MPIRLAPPAKDRALEVAALPHVKAWVRRFEKLVKSIPPEVWVFVASGTPTVMALDPDGKHYEKSHGGMDDGAIVARLHRGSGTWDGGDW